MYTTNQCPICDSEFTPRNSSHKFCCRSCQEKDSRDRRGETIIPRDTPPDPCLPNEIWTPICHAPDYDISNKGRIRRGINTEYGNGTYPGKVLKTWKDKKGYESRQVIAPNRKNSRKNISIHRAVADAFLPPKPGEMYQVNHKSGDKTDNCVDNLEWVTPKENMRHAIKNGLYDKKRLRFHTINGRTMHLAAWAKETGIDYSILIKRSVRGDEGDSLIRPPIKKPRQVDLPLQPGRDFFV